MFDKKHKKNHLHQVVYLMVALSMMMSGSKWWHFDIMGVYWWHWKPPDPHHMSIIARTWTLVRSPENCDDIPWLKRNSLPLISIFNDINQDNPGMTQRYFGESRFTKNAFYTKDTPSFQGGITCGAIDEPRKSSKAIDKRVIINFRDKNGVIARFCDKNVYR